MKLFTILLLTILYISLQGQTLPGGWTIRKSPAQGLLTCGSFANEDVGWIGGIGSLMKTTNGGETYQLQFPTSKGNKRYWFNSITCISENEAVVSGFAYGSNDSGIFMRTRDGGKTWESIMTPEDSNKYSGVIFPNQKSTGFVINSKEQLLISKNKGKDWEMCNTPQSKINIVSKRSISSASPQVLYAVGSAHTSDMYILRSDDNGKTWQKISIPAEVIKPRAPIFVDIETAGPENIWVEAYGGDCIESHDGGKTWRQSKAPGKVFMRDKMRGYAISNYTVSETTDGGKTWSKPQTVSGGRSKMNYVIFTDKKDIIVGGNEGTGTYFIIDRPANEEDIGKDKILLATDNSEQGTLINFNQPEDGYVSLRIKDSEGNVVNNLLNGLFLKKGKHTVLWNLSTIDDYWQPFSKKRKFLYTPDETAPKVAQAGNYTWEAILTPVLKLDYAFSYYPLKKHGEAWLTPDNTGGWLGDHSAPKDAIAVEDTVWVGTFCESGHSLLEANLDMKKLWGTGRIKLACPKVLANDGQYIYFIEQGGWLKFAKQHLAIIQVDKKTKEARRILAISQNDKLASELSDIRGFVVLGNKAFIADHSSNLIFLLDIKDNLEEKSEDIKIIRRISIESPRRIRMYRKNQLAIATKDSIKVLNLDTFRQQTVIKGLKNAYGLDVDNDGNFYVGESEPIHQVKVFSNTGKLLRIIGKPGKHKLGKFDKNNLESPTGIAVDSNGNVWVCENNEELKRTSVWNKEGVCINDVIGPTEYGGGGTIDPKNENRCFYRGKEIVRDSKHEKFYLKNIIWRLDSEEYRSFVEKRPHNFNGPSPEFPFYKEGKLFFSMWGGFGMGEITTLFVYEKDHVKPAAAVGVIQDWMKTEFNIPSDHYIFAWTDLNNDGQIDENEIESSSACQKMRTIWGVRMNNNFEVAFSTDVGEVGIAFFEVDKLTKDGYPIYKLPTEFTMMPNLIANDPNQVQYVSVDNQGNAIAVSPFLFSLSPSGKVNWRMKCRWPGLHAGRNTDATGMEPGLLIASERIWGMAKTDGDAGDVFCLNGDFGSVELITTDGFYLGRPFKDCRGANSWNFNKPPTSEELSNLSLGQEHFGGSFQRVEGNDGKPHYYFVVSPRSPACNVIEVTGLDQVKRFANGKLRITQKDIYVAEKLRQKKAFKQKELKEYTIIKSAGTPDWKNIKSIDGFQLAYDNNNLYLRFQGKDKMAVFQNASTSANFEEAFTMGDVIDLKLQTKSNANFDRSSAEEGDIRLSFAMVDNKPQAILYDYVVPGTKTPYTFTAPHHSTAIDKISLLQNVIIKIERNSQDNYTLEATIPLIDLNLRPTSGMKVAGDVGKVVSDQTGTTRINRIYWSNDNTKTVSDIPSEARIQPNLWGTFIFE